MTGPAHQLDDLVHDLNQIVTGKVVHLTAKHLAVATSLLELPRYIGLEPENSQALLLRDLAQAIGYFDEEDALQLRVLLRLADDEELTRLGVDNPLLTSHREKALAPYVFLGGGDTVRRRRPLLLAKLAFALVQMQPEIERKLRPAGLRVVRAEWRLRELSSGMRVISHSADVEHLGDPNEHALYVCYRPRGGLLEDQEIRAGYGLLNDRPTFELTTVPQPCVVSWLPGDYTYDSEPEPIFVEWRNGPPSRRQTGVNSMTILVPYLTQEFELVIDAPGAEDHVFIVHEPPDPDGRFENSDDGRLTLSALAPGTRVSCMYAT